MALMAMVLPLVPGQRTRWDAWIKALQGPRRTEYVASRREAGVRERTFLQVTPVGDLVIVTLEGDEPMASFVRLLGKDDEFTKWFVENASAAHGLDLSQPMREAPSTLLLDSDDENDTPPREPRAGTR